MAKEFDVKEMAKKASVSEQDMERALTLLKAEKVRKEKIARGEIKGTTYKKRSEMTKEELEKQKKLDRKYLARTQIILQKARAQGITATEKEIEEYLAKK